MLPSPLLSHRTRSTRTRTPKSTYVPTLPRKHHTATHISSHHAVASASRTRKPKGNTRREQVVDLLKKD